MVSIIVPFYDSEKYIEQCLLSAQAQTCTDIEILCISDGSEDGSEDIVRKFEKTDPRFRLILQSKSNAGQARNTGIEHARGEYLCFLDSDDFLTPDMIEKMINKCKETNCDVCFCDADDYHESKSSYVYSKNRYLNEHYMPNAQPFSPFEISDYIFQATTSVPWGKFFRTAFVKESRIKFQSVPRNNDIFFVSMMCALAQRITYIVEVLVHHRVGITSNLQSRHYETPEIYSYVMKGLYKELQNREIYAAYERSFLCLVVAGTRHVFERLVTHGVLGDFINSCRQMYLELNLFDAFRRTGESLIEKKDDLELDVFYGFVADMYSLKQMNIYDMSLESTFIQTVHILREKYMEVLQQFPLNKSNQKVGFYGMGKHTQGLFAVYKKMIGKVNAKIVYVVSEKASDNMDGIKQISYREIDDSFDAIIVSSYIYNDEMLKNLSTICSKARIISFYPQYKKDIFAGFCDHKGLFEVL